MGKEVHPYLCKTPWSSYTFYITVEKFTLYFATFSLALLNSVMTLWTNTTLPKSSKIPPFKKNVQMRDDNGRTICDHENSCCGDEIGTILKNLKQALFNFYKGRKIKRHGIHWNRFQACEFASLSFISQEFRNRTCRSG